MNNESFKILRRNSLRNEVDGTFDELEEFEDRNEASPGEFTPSSRISIVISRVVQIILGSISTIDYYRWLNYNAVQPQSVS